MLSTYFLLESLSLNSKFTKLAGQQAWGISLSPALGVMGLNGCNHIFMWFLGDRTQVLIVVTANLFLTGLSGDSQIPVLSPL